jgi:GTPase SAR1 family protein
MTMADATIDAPEVPILLLGDAEVGKSTFLS